MKSHQSLNNKCYLNFPCHVHSANNLSKDDVLVVQPLCLLYRQEELAAVGPGAGVGHG